MKNLKSILKSLILFLFFALHAGTLFSQSDTVFFDEIEQLSVDGNYKKAIKVCDKAIQANENFIQAYVKKSYLLVNLEKYDEALGALNDGLGANKTNSHLYHERGLLYQSFNRIVSWKCVCIQKPCVDLY